MAHNTAECKECQEWAKGIEGNLKDASLKLADILNTYNEDPEDAENQFELFSKKWDEDQIDVMCEMLEAELPWENDND